MTQLESILKGIDALSDDERAEILAKLLQIATPEPEADEIAAGQRGLASWTQSTRNESWTEFYPAELRGAGGPAA